MQRLAGRMFQEVGCAVLARAEGRFTGISSELLSKND
jgi:hypothetical protein